MSRHRVHKGHSSKSFRSRSGKTHRVNMVSRGGFRL